MQSCIKLFEEGKGIDIHNTQQNGGKKKEISELIKLMQFCF